jgi:SulP family sulfate permease
LNPISIKRFFPIYQWLPNYNKSWLKGDLNAGLTVGIMLIPQGMAYASIAGLPPVYGLYASILPLLIYAVLGTSRQLAVGPVAMVSLLTAASLSAIPGLTPEQYIQYAIGLALLVGLIQFTLGIFRLGFLVNFLSHPVVSGFTSGAAIIIGLSQLKHILGIQIKGSEHIHELALQIAEKMHEVNGMAVIIGLIGIGLIFAIRKWKKTLPGQLIAVLFGIAAVSIFHLDEGPQGIKIIKDIPNNLPAFSLLIPDWMVLKSLLPMAVTIALVSFMESIAVAKSIESKHKDYKVMANQELIALGAANVLGSFFQSYPVTGGFSRTAVNDQAGANTPLASIISAALVFLTLLFLTPYFYNLPHAILAAVIIVAVIGLINYQEAIHLWHSNKMDFWMLMLTFIFTLVFGVEMGIGVGVFLSLALVLFSTTYPHTAVLAKVPGSHFYRNVERFKDLEVNENLLIYRFDAQLFFANINHFKDKLYEYETEKHGHLKLLIIDGESINNIDSTSVNTLDEIVHDFNARGVEVCFTGVKGPVRDKLAQSGFTDRVGCDHFFMSIQEAVDCFNGKCLNETQTDPKFQNFVSQAKG